MCAEHRQQAIPSSSRSAWLSDKALRYNDLEEFTAIGRAEKLFRLINADGSGNT
jgi:hypothetical protein